MYRFRFRLPETFTLLIRALSVLEGLALSADPNYRVVASAFPWVARRVLLERSPELQEALRALLYSSSPLPPPSSSSRSGDIADNTGQDDEPLFDFGRLEALLREAARVPGGANPARHGGGGGGGAGVDGDEDDSALALLLSPDAEFVRGLLEDELAKGLDAAWRLAADRALGALPLLSLLPPLPVFAAAAAAPPPPPRPLQQQQQQQRQQQPRRPRRLATARDEAQIEGLSRLAAAVGGLVASASASPSSSSSSSPCPTATARAQQAAQALEWLAREARALPPEARREAAALPLRVAAKLSSRVAARAIRAALL
jgi:hypothetical protein